MLSRLIDHCQRSRRAVVAAALVIGVIGFWQLREAKVDALPEFGPPTVRVQTEALGLSAEEVEQLITVPMEQDLLDGVAWLDTIHSKSVPGLSSIEMTFEKGTNLYRARQVVQERISQAAGLPNVSRPPQMIQPESSTSRTAMVALTSDRLTALQIGVLARWTIRPRLLAVPGVSNVAIWGQRERQLQVQVDPAKLAQKNVSLEQVISSTGNALWVSPLTFLEASTPGTGGFIDTANQRLGIQHNSPIIAPRDLAEIPIAETNGEQLTLGDVATVVEDHQPLIGDAIVSGKARNDATFLLVIDRLPHANTSEVTRRIQKTLDELRPGLAGLTMDASVFRPADYVHSSVHNLARSVFIGAMVLAAALIVLLRGLRRTIIAFAAVSVSFMASALFLHAIGRPFDAFVLVGFGVALTAVLDDGLGEAGSVAARRVLWAAAISLVALSPIFIMNGLSGDAFYRPLAIGAATAVIASLLVSVTLTPALSALMPVHGRPAGTARSLERRYDGLLTRFAFTRNRVVAVAAVVACVALAGGAAVAGAAVHKALLPDFRDPNLVVQWDAPFGTSLPETGRIVERAVAEVRTIPGVRRVVAHVGQAVLGDQAVGSDSAQIWISLDPRAAYEKTVSAVRRAIGGYPGMSHDVTTYAKQRIRSVLGRAGDPVTVRVFGDDLGVLQRKAGEIRTRLIAIKGTANVRVSAAPAEPTMEIEVNLAKAQLQGIKPGDVRRAAATLLSGLKVGSLFQQQKIFDVVVWTAPSSRRSITDVRNLLIDTPSGKHIRIGDVADVRVRPTRPIIEHQDISRFVDVSADVRGRSAGAVTRDLRAQLAEVNFPLEYHAEVLHTYAHQQNSQRRLAWFAIAAVLALFLLLQAAFGSWKLAGLIVLTLPLSVAGAVLVAAAGGTLTLAGLAGVLAVLLVAIRFAIGLADACKRRSTAGTTFGPELVSGAAADRIRPTLNTAMAGALFLLPVLVVGSRPGLEMIRPMAAATLGGLFTAVVVALVLLPPAFLWLKPDISSGALDLDAAAARSPEARA